jgi:hypothetical protein
MSRTASSHMGASKNIPLWCDNRCSGWHSVGALYNGARTHFGSRTVCPPWRSWRGWPVTNADSAKAPGEKLAVDPIVIADDVRRRCPCRKSNPNILVVYLHKDSPVSRAVQAVERVFPTPIRGGLQMSNRLPALLKTELGRCSAHLTPCSATRETPTCKKPLPGYIQNKASGWGEGGELRAGLCGLHSGAE